MYDIVLVGGRKEGRSMGYGGGGFTGWDRLGAGSFGQEGGRGDHGGED